MWANGLTLGGPLAEVLVIGLWLSSAQPLLDESCEKLMKFLCSLSSSFGEKCMRLVSGSGLLLLTQAQKSGDLEFRGCWSV